MTRTEALDVDRLTPADRLTMTGAVVAAVDLDRPRADLDDAERARLAMLAAHSIGCTLSDLRGSELHWLTGMIVLVAGLADIR